MSSNSHAMGFYVEVRENEWRHIAGSVALKPRSNRKLVLGEMRSSKDGKVMVFRVVKPGSLVIRFGAELERPVKDGEAVKQKDFVIKDEEGTETRVIWSAGKTVSVSSKQVLVCPPDEDEIDLTDA